MTIIHPHAVPEPEANRNPDCAEALAALAAAYQTDDTMTAGGLLARAYALAPHHDEIISAYGLFLHDQGDHTAAQPLLQQAVQTGRARTDIILAYAANCTALMLHEQAEQVLKAALATQPDNVTLLCALAEQRATQADWPAAVQLGREAIQLRPPVAEFCRAYAMWLAQSGDYRAALEALGQHVYANPNDALGWQQLSHYWSMVQEPQKAAQALAHYLALCPEAEMACNSPAPTNDTLSGAYVRALFDGYADQFDHDLQDKLRYRAPALLAHAVRPFLSPQPCHLLDLGCGTGLGAHAFAGHNLLPAIGIDLAPRMLAHAEKTGLYRQLIAGDVVEECNQLHEVFNLIIAADVLVYLGDLTPLFSAVRKKLSPQGLFAATVEHQEEFGAWHLQPQRRYAHSRAYITQLAAAHKLTILTLENCTPRTENNQPVAGLLFVMQPLQS
jgi:predicted TPR repeat methyltransferase